MPRARKSSPRAGISSGLLESSIRGAFRRAYTQVQVDPQKYLDSFRRAHRLHIETWDDMFHLGEEVISYHAGRIISVASKAAALEGAGFGIGGMLTVLPDLGVLSAITIRMIQKLSLIHGFEYASDDEIAELWFAAASAAGLDLGREFLEKQAIEKLVPRIIDRIAIKVGSEFAEKWTARAIPILSAGAGGTLNYYFVRAWGRRAQKHFIEKHRHARRKKLGNPVAFPAPPALLDS
jgi:hypothetical protein